MYCKQVDLASTEPISMPSIGHIGRKSYKELLFFKIFPIVLAIPWQAIQQPYKKANFQSLALTRRVRDRRVERGEEGGREQGRPMPKLGMGQGGNDERGRREEGGRTTLEGMSAPEGENEADRLGREGRRGRRAFSLRGVVEGGVGGFGFGQRRRRRARTQQLRAVLLLALAIAVKVGCGSSWRLTAMDAGDRACRENDTRERRDCRCGREGVSARGRCRRAGRAGRRKRTREAS